LQNETNTVFVVFFSRILLAALTRWHAHTRLFKKSTFSILMLGAAHTYALLRGWHLYSVVRWQKTPG